LLVPAQVKLKELPQAKGKIWGALTLLLVALAGAVGISMFRHSVGDVVMPPHVPEIATSAPHAAILPLPQTISLDARKIALGKRLFHDPSLSANGTISCASCHNLANGGVDRKPRSMGIGGKMGNINAPTVFNSGFNFRQFWDGRAATLEDQVNGPLQNATEMGSSWPQAITVLSKDSHYRSAFRAIYRDGIQPQNVRDAIATFERSLITPNSRFDRYLRGDAAAITQEELEGYRLFSQIGCVSCHQGVNIGGNLYQKLGIMEDYFPGGGKAAKADMGLYNVTGKEEDRYYFKVPSLRNVALTAPYLHDSSAPTLDDAIKTMARYQLGRNLDAAEVSRISAFLRTLTGEYQGKPLQ